MSKIQEEAYSELCQENERLGAEVASYKGLLKRAAEALEKYTAYPLGMVMSVTLRESGREIIVELRKAVEWVKH